MKQEEKLNELKFQNINVWQEWNCYVYDASW